MMDWLIAFLNKTPAELMVGEAALMLLVICLVGIGICLIFLKALSPPSNSIRFPKAAPGTVNPFAVVLKKRQEQKKRKAREKE